MRSNASNIWPLACIRVIQLFPQREIHALYSVGHYGVCWTFRLAYSAVYAFIRVYDQHVFAFIKTVHRAYLDAIHVLAADAIVSDYVRHENLLVCRSMQKW
jgi:hypothetical protein